MIFRIPVMNIQDCAVRFFQKVTSSKAEVNKDYVVLILYLEKIIEEHRTNWGIEGKGYKVLFDLENQWYPIFEFKNRWLADAFMKHLSKIGLSK